MNLGDVSMPDGEYEIESQEPSPKKQYQSPELTEYGSLTDLTQGAGNVDFDGIEGTEGAGL